MRIFLLYDKELSHDSVERRIDVWWRGEENGYLNERHLVYPKSGGGVASILPVTLPVKSRWRPVLIGLVRYCF